MSGVPSSRRLERGFEMRLRRFFAPAIPPILLLLVLLSPSDLPGTWIGDVNRNQIDDRIDAMDSGEIIDVIVDYGRRPIPGDLSFLNAYGDSAREMISPHFSKLKLRSAKGGTNQMATSST